METATAMIMMKEEQRSRLLTAPRPFGCHHTGRFLLIVPAVNSLSFFPRVVGKKRAVDLLY